MKKLIIAVLAASTAALAIQAQAETADRQGRAENFRAGMRALIAGDGMDVAALANLMQERAQARFAALDANGDGIVSRDEMLAAAGERAQARFERMQPDENGIVRREGREGWGRPHRDGPRAEGHGHRHRPDAENRTGRQHERAAEQFSRLDTDGDGMLSPQEYEAGMRERAERFAGRHGGWRHGEVPAEMRQMHAELRTLMREGMNLDSFSGLMQERAGARFEALDTDGDGALTAAEFTAGIAERAQQLFARMDRNEDGVVTRDDRPHRGGWRHGWRK